MSRQKQGGGDDNHDGRNGRNGGIDIITESAEDLFDESSFYSAESEDEDGNDHGRFRLISRYLDVEFQK